MSVLGVEYVMMMVREMYYNHNMGAEANSVKTGDMGRPTRPSCTPHHTHIPDTPLRVQTQILGWYTKSPTATVDDMVTVT